MAFWRKNERRKNRSRTSHLRAAVHSSERSRIARGRVATLLGWGLALATLAAFLLWGGNELWRGMFLENSFFDIRQLDVTTDGSLGVTDILEVAKVRVGVNLFSVRPQDIREALLTVPVISDAQVGRRFPDGLIIEVTERIAVARLGRAGAGSPLAVDSTGHVLGPRSVRVSLPVIQGIRDVGLRPGDVVADSSLQSALSILETCNTEKMRPEITVTTIDVAHDERIEILLSTGEKAWLSPEHIPEKLWKLTEMRKAARTRGLALDMYDLTVDRNFVGR